MQKTYKNSSGKNVGVLIDDVYEKVVTRSKHLMKMFNGYGIDEEIFKDLRSNGCTLIKIKEIDTGTIFEVPFSVFDEHKILKQFDGPQYFIQGKYLQHEDNQQKLTLT